MSVDFSEPLNIAALAAARRASSAAPADALQARLQACEEQYQLHFAQQVRLTCAPQLLQQLCAELAAVQTLATQHNQPAVAELAQQLLASYQHEQTCIVEAQTQAGPRGRYVAVLARRSSLLMHRYARHFAGQPRPSRDVSLLQATQQELQPLASALQAHAALPQAAVVQQTCAMYAQEIERVQQARQQGNALQQAVHLASAANTLMQTYVDCCVERQRLAVRPALLSRLCVALQTLLQAMQQLQLQPVANAAQLQHHVASCAALETQLQTWQREQAHTAAAHTAASPPQRLNALNVELDAVLQAYNTWPATDPTPPVAELVALCDRLDEIAQQLTELPPTAEQNAAQQVTTDALAMLCQRHDAALSQNASVASA